MILFEIIIILIWICCLLYSIKNKRFSSFTSLLLISMVISFIFILIDDYYAQIVYTSKINIPWTNYPIPIIVLGSLYFTSVVVIQNLIINKLFKISNKIIKQIIRFCIILVFNLFYPIVDFIIVNIKDGFFIDNHINIFYKTFEYNSEIILYQVMAYLFFFMSIYLSWIINLLLIRVFNLKE